MVTGRLSLITGPMFSGKGEELARRVRRSLLTTRAVHLFQPHAGAFSGHRTIDAGTRRREILVIDRPDEILRACGAIQSGALVAVEDAHFLSAGLVEVANYLVEQGAHVLLAGLDTDFRGEPFGIMGHLLAIADEVSKLAAECPICGAAATRTQRVLGGRRAPWGAPITLAGGPECYQPRCRRCFVVPRHDDDQVALL